MPGLVQWRDKPNTDVMKKTSSHIAIAIALASSLALVACAKDPTDGKTRAQVGQARSAAAAPPTAEQIAITPAGSSIRFLGAKVTAQHPGRFTDFSGTISLVEGAPEKSHVEVQIQMASLSTDERIAKLDAHLRSADFFDVEQHPTARFVSTEIRPESGAAGATHAVTGNLTLRGVTRSVTFPAAITVGPGAVTVKAEFGINRQDFGIAYRGMTDDLIKDHVLLTIDVAAPRGTPGA
jgi:polyisoprenoid-binding protein YceI